MELQWIYVFIQLIPINIIQLIPLIRTALTKQCPMYWGNPPQRAATHAFVSFRYCWCLRFGESYNWLPWSILMLESCVYDRARPSHAWNLRVNIDAWVVCVSSCKRIICMKPSDQYWCLSRVCIIVHTHHVHETFGSILMLESCVYHRAHASNAWNLRVNIDARVVCVSSCTRITCMKLTV